MLIKYGKAPFSVALINGGPGTAGEMSPVAQVLSSNRGILEPFQSKKSIHGQLQELKTLLEREADFPVVLVGFSWGAWLSFLFAAEYPKLVKKLVLIGSGPYEDKYVDSLKETRLNRLSAEEKEEIDSLLKNLDDPQYRDKNTSFQRLGDLFSKAEAFDPLPRNSETILAQYDIYEAIWKEAKELRSSGKLLETGKRIQCPVTAIHGEYDAHPLEGVRDPLFQILKQFHFILLKDCGHYPWLERRAKEQFYTLLKEELL